MNTKPKLHQSLAFNLIAALGIAVCFGARPGVAQTSVVGQWSTGPTWPEFPVHAHLLPTGKVMIWPGDQGQTIQQPQSWNPADQNVQNVSTLPKAGYDLFCSGHSLLADGKLFVAGGHIQNGVGVKNASIYDPVANAWTALPDMNFGRWYPTATVLANGDVLVVSGSIDSTFGNDTLPQVYQVGSGTWRNLNLAQLGMDLYPQMLLAPNGKVFNPGPTQDTRYLDTAGTGTWSYPNPPVSLRRVGPYRDYGSAVMYAPGQVLVMGGGDPPTNTAEVIDLNQPSPTWRAVAPMAVARRQLNATLLPDGTVLVTGGTRGNGFNNTGLDEFGLPNPVYAAELWEPPTGGTPGGRWTTLASSSLSIPRVYHSTAVLLPDTRVLIMGGNGNLQRTSEIYSPPYLFKGARPTIGSELPNFVAYGQTFVVPVTSDVTQIAKVTMLRLSSVTHAFNMSQYINTWTKGSIPSTLTFSQVAGGLNLVAPSAAAVESSTAPAVAPPGPYMLFILNESGVPSDAKIVKVGSDPAALTLSALSPHTVAADGLAFTLTVNGSNFVSGSVVRWNGVARPTTFVSATRLTAAVPANDIAVPGTASVTVVNPGGAVSNAVTFTIGAISREVWLGIPGTAVANIPLAAPPNITDMLPSFETADWGDNYGTRMRGYITAPVAGNYIFWIASDDNSELYLSTDENPGNKVKIASVPDWTTPREWNKYSSQKSGTISLTQGQRCYVEALQKEGGGGDNLAVGWAKPGDASTSVIPASVLSPFTGTTLQFSAATYSVGENAGNAAVTVTRTGGSSGAVSVSFATSNGTATAPGDYTAVSPNPTVISFADGQTAKTVNIPILNDISAEANETVNLTLSNPSQTAKLGTPSTAVLTITDDDVAPAPPAGTFQFSAPTYSVGENAENAGNAAVTVTRTEGSSGAVSVSFATSNGTATASVDYTAVSPNPPISFADGQTAKTVNIPILNDTTAEENETVNLTLSSPTGGATLGTPSTAVLTITDNDVAPAPPVGTFQFSAPTYSVAENSGKAAVIVTRIGGSSGAVSVSFATSNGTATAPGDYTPVTQTVNFANGDTANKTVNIQIIKDKTAEADETVNLTLSSPSPTLLGSPSTAVLTIRGQRN